MKEEIAATVFFVARLAKKHGKLERSCRERFAVAFTSVLFETYKSHWYPEKPCKGQAFRCLRMNKAQMRDPVIGRACKQSNIDYEDLGLPKEITIWVDPGEVSCRYGEKNAPFCVALLEGQKGDREFSRRINNAVERASSDYHSGTSSDEEGANSSLSTINVSMSSSSSSSTHSAPEPKCIPTVSNPNSVYQLSDFGPPPSMPSWTAYPKRKPYAAEGYQQHSNGQYPPHNGFKNYRPSYAFSGPRMDKYHWVSKSRS
ncbi:protein BTG4 [Silurus asotus]|uniref:Protein BTG4 n=1 Tax=Silurus asotus TaxID=30991 RepID=A0AAD5A2X0_SILAS|nr:protein BTG4 [Silurus asotus]